MADRIYTSFEIEEKYGISRQTLLKYCRTGYIRYLCLEDLPLDYVINCKLRKNAYYCTESEINRFLDYKISGGYLGSREELRLSSGDFDLKGIIRNRYNPIIVEDSKVYDTIPKDLLQRICDINLVDFREELN